MGWTPRANVLKEAQVFLAHFYTVTTVTKTDTNTFSWFLVLKVGLGISRTNADSQWNPVYNAFH